LPRLDRHDLSKWSVVQVATTNPKSEGCSSEPSWMALDDGASERNPDEPGEERDAKHYER